MHVHQKCFRPHRIYLQYASSARLVKLSTRYFSATRSRTKAKRTGENARKKGLLLENRVKRLLISEGRYNVKQNVMLKDKHGNKSEIDLTYNIFPPWWIFGNKTRHVECKNYAKGKSVPLEDVSKFKSVLDLNGIDNKHGIFVTTSTFSPRCESAAGKIKLINGDELKRWEKKVYSTKYTKLFLQALAVGGIVHLGIETYISTS